MKNGWDGGPAKKSCLRDWSCGSFAVELQRGSDEGDEICSAAADVAYNAEDDTITGTLRYHLGDELPFIWRRDIAATKKAVKRFSARRPKRK